MVDRSIRGLSRPDRLCLCTLPTPLVEAKRLTESLHGPRVFIKRDDLTGLAVGGNKARALEFVMAEARARGSDVVLAVGPQHSNQLCAIAAAARKCGMDVVLLLLKGDNRPRGNLLLFHLLGAQVEFTDIDLVDVDEACAQMERLAAQLRNEGRRPLELRYGPLPLVGMAGYVLLMCEILEQLGDEQPGEEQPGEEQSGHVPAGTRHLFLGSGSGLTQAGLILGNALMGADYRINGVMLDPRFRREEHGRNVLAAVQATAALFETNAASGTSAGFGPSDVLCIDGYADDATQTNAKAARALRLVAETEGIFLDPVYTGRVMAAMIDQIRAGDIPPEDDVIFYHSGGIPAIFSHGDMLLGDLIVGGTVVGETESIQGSDP
jgi:1-aminocyclopropane-1-carboxylate deaminase/D-cysteine desulfhydrase-like pyridoxal-dependent ACC family enzyme